MPTVICQHFVEFQPEHLSGDTADADLKGRISVKGALEPTAAESLYDGVRYLLFTRQAQKGLTARRGVFTVREDAVTKKIDAQDLALMSVLGRLIAQGYVDALGGRTGRSSEDVSADWDAAGTPGTPVRLSPRFVSAVNNAFNEYASSQPLHEAVFSQLLAAGAPEHPAVPKDKHSVISASQLVAVVDHLRRSGRGIGDPLLNVYVTQALSATDYGGGVPAGGSAPLVGASSVPIDLIDLEEEATSATLIKANLVALSFLYQAAILEELKVPVCVERMVQHFVEGTTPVSTGTGPDLLYEYFRTTQDRLTEVERRSLFARAFGLAQGSVEVELPNREFQDMWIRALSSISGYNREQGAFVRKSVLEEQVHKALRDLGANLSLHGYGMVHFAAVELQNTYAFYFKMLDHAELQLAYGVRNRWQLVERISQMYLGGAVNGVKMRTMAQSGGRIIRWLADHVPALSDSGAPHEFGKNYVLAKVMMGDLETSLAAEAEKWVAVTGTNNATVNQFSESVSLTNQQSLPAVSFGGVADLQRLQDTARSLIPQA